MYILYITHILYPIYPIHCRYGVGWNLTVLLTIIAYKNLYFIKY